MADPRCDELLLMMWCAISAVIPPKWQNDGKQKWCTFYSQGLQQFYILDWNEQIYTAAMDVRFNRNTFHCRCDVRVYDSNEVKTYRNPLNQRINWTGEIAQTKKPNNNNGTNRTTKKKQNAYTNGKSAKPNKSRLMFREICDHTIYRI